MSSHCADGHGGPGENPRTRRHCPADLPPVEPRPNLFVVGGAKSGTTSLHRLFELAPEIGTARTRKELHFFSAPDLLSHVAGPGDARVMEMIVQNEATYLAEFSHLDPGLPVIVDVSPSYLQNPPAAARIHAFAPEARIIILLREPAARVFSQYVHLWSEGRESLPFEEAYARSAERRAAGYSRMFDYAAAGYYAAAVGRYLTLFGPERVLVLLFEEMKQDWLASRARLETFLGAALPFGDLPRMNAGGKVRSPIAAYILGNPHLKGMLRAVVPLGLRTRLSERVRGAINTDRPALSPKMQDALRRRYAEDVAALEQLLGRTTRWPSS